MYLFIFSIVLMHTAETWNKTSDVKNKLLPQAPFKKIKVHVLEEWKHAPLLSYPIQYTWLWYNYCIFAWRKVNSTFLCGKVRKIVNLINKLYSNFNFSNLNLYEERRVTIFCWIPTMANNSAFPDILSF